MDKFDVVSSPVNHREMRTFLDRQRWFSGGLYFCS